jgi:hypothetical protein
MTRVIWPKASYLEKPWNSIPNNKMLKDEIEKIISIVEKNLKQK